MDHLLYLQKHWSISLCPDCPYAGAIYWKQKAKETLHPDVRSQMVALQEQL
jgi:hypothetical protein